MKSFKKTIALVLLAGFIASPVYAEDDENSEEKPLIIDNSTNAGAAGKKNVSAKTLDLLTRINQLETEIRQLRGEIELMAHDIKGIKHRQRELYGDMDRRLRELELRMQGKLPPAGSNKASTKTTGPRYSTGSSSRPVTGRKPVKKQAVIGSYTPPKAGERRAYQRAFALLRKSRYNLAITELRNFLAKYPSGGYSDTAQYWLAEAYYASRKYRNAIKEFTKLVQNYPNSPKVAASKVKIGFSHNRVRQYSAARKMLQSVMRDYPGSSSATLARLRLNAMRREGH